ncbi:HipA N-terminal domain-containing protein [Achromobacter ruhlandii]|uniref:HipA N-terminal domain-containing protein n=1 Tax=Achromobacter ruhlandii TaxID=72557 RepID=UPI003B9B0D23
MSFPFSLRMPTSQRSWRSRELFPAFQVSMPEGWLLHQVENALAAVGLQATPLRILEDLGAQARALGGESRTFTPPSQPASPSLLLLILVFEGTASASRWRTGSRATAS